MTTIYILGGLFCGWAMLSMLGSERTRLKIEADAHAAMKAEDESADDTVTAKVIGPGASAHVKK